MSFKKNGKSTSLGVVEIKEPKQQEVVAPKDSDKKTAQPTAEQVKPHDV
jgi:hypothetical protein